MRARFTPLVGGPTTTGENRATPAAGVPTRATAGPRVHDLRHTFAVNNLRFWFAQGQDVGALLPVLQTYMGHSSLRDTAYYLRLTAESYPNITTRVERATGDVVPPVAAGPCHGD